MLFQCSSATPQVVRVHSVIMVDVTYSSMIMITLDVEADSSLRFERYRENRNALSQQDLRTCLVMVIHNCTPLLLD
jgi:hypothetical protein